MKSFLNISKNNFFSQILVVTSGNVIARAIGIISLPLITRLYTSDQFGIFTTFLSYFTILSSITTLRYFVPVTIAKSEKEVGNLIKLCFSIAGVFFVISFLIITFFGNEISSLINEPSIQVFLFILPFLLLFKGIFDSLRSFVIRKQQFKKLTNVLVVQSSLSAITKVVMGYAGIKKFGLFLGLIGQHFIGVVFLIFSFRKHLINFFKNSQYKDMLYVANRYKRFPLIQSWSSFLLVFSNQLPIIFLSFLFDNSIVGLFGLAIGMVSLPMNLIGQSVGDVFYGKISSFGTTKADKIRLLAKSTLIRISLIALVPSIVLLFFGEDLFSFAFGEKWLKSGTFASYLTVLIFFRLIVSPFGGIFNLFEKQFSQLWLNFLKILLVSGVFLTANLIDLNSENTILLYSLVMPIHSLVVLILIFKITGKNHNNYET